METKQLAKNRTPSSSQHSLEKFKFIDFISMFYFSSISSHVLRNGWIVFCIALAGDGIQVVHFYGMLSIRFVYCTTYSNT